MYLIEQSTRVFVAEIQLDQSFLAQYHRTLSVALSWERKQSRNPPRSSGDEDPSTHMSPCGLTTGPSIGDCISSSLNLERRYTPEK